MAKHHKGGHMVHPHHHDGHMTKEAHMSHRGHDQGNMSPTVEDYQRPTHNFAEHQFGKTLEYIERHDRYEGKEAKGIEKQAYIGRYS